MASQDHHYTTNFKATVALEALAQQKRNLDQLSKKYDVPVSLILTWTVQLERNAPAIYATTPEPTDVAAEETDTYVSVTIDNDEINQGVSSGVMRDDLDVKKLAFWSVLGIVFIIIFTQLLKEMYDQSTQINQERKAANTEYQVSLDKQQSRKELSSFGVVDIEKGIYRMPIDSVINDMAVDTK